jgi:hypothetical protein
MKKKGSKRNYLGSNSGKGKLLEKIVSKVEVRVSGVDTKDLLENKTAFDVLSGGSIVFCPAHLNFI